MDYSVAKQKAMKVLSHEDDVLRNGYGVELASIKREYYRICVGLVDDFAKANDLKSVGTDASVAGGINTRTAVMGLFGAWFLPAAEPYFILNTLISIKIIHPCSSYSWRYNFISIR